MREGGREAPRRVDARPESVHAQTGMRGKGHAKAVGAAATARGAAYEPRVSALQERPIAAKCG